METIDSKTWDGVQILLDHYAKIGAGDFVVVLYTTDSAESAAWVSAALELRGIPSRRVWMAPLWDDGFLARLAPVLPDPAAFDGRLVVLGFERDTMSHTRLLAPVVSKYKGARVFRAISSCPNLFSTALHVLPEDLTARNTAILERLMSAERLHITTEGGSDFHVTLDPKHRWISNRGVARPGKVAILPAGEVATFPASIAGTFVADFAFNVNAVTQRDARLQDYPVTLWIEEGRAVKFECASPSVTNFLEESFRAHCAYNVGELGFGTNTAVTEAISLNSHINERRPGVHLGFGQHNQDPGIVGYQCAIHLDLIARGGLVWVDDDEIPMNLESIAPSARQHPETTRDEDVFDGTEDLEIDDCCGLLTEEGFRLFCPPSAAS